jgi:hypothetical protein
MIKSIVLHDIDMSQIAAMERWYYRDHAPEINRRFGPWLARHDSFLPVDAPFAARQYGFFNWRMTEGTWRELPESGRRGNLSFTVPPVWPRVATCFIPAQPTDDFLGREYQPHERNVLRWYQLIRYPAGVPHKQAEQWFVNVHAAEVMRQPKLFRYFSTRVIGVPTGLPGTWPPAAAPPPESVMHTWDRVCELWYETFDDWRESVIDSPPQYTRPPWDGYAGYPFFEPNVDFVSSFLLERPNDEFARDARGYL